MTTGQHFDRGTMAPVGAGWSWAGPELRRRAFYNPLSMATGHNLLSRQTERSSGLWLSEHLLFLCASISHLLPNQTFHVADLSRPQLEESRAAGRDGPVTTAAHRHRHGRPAWPGAVFKVRGAVQFNITDFILHFPLSRCPQEATFFPWQRAINSGFLCACVDSLIFQHDRIRLFWCKHSCFIKFTLFLFFYFKLYTFGK